MVLLQYASSNHIITTCPGKTFSSPHDQRPHGVLARSHQIYVGAVSQVLYETKLNISEVNQRSMNQGIWNPTNQVSLEAACWRLLIQVPMTNCESLHPSNPSSDGAGRFGITKEDIHCIGHITLKNIDVVDPSSTRTQLTTHKLCPSASRKIDVCIFI